MLKTKLSVVAEDALEELAHLNKAVVEHSGDPAVWTARGDLHTSPRLGERGKLSRGMNDYEIALAIDPTYSAAWRGKGNALFSQGKYDEAAEALTKALANGDNSVGVYLRRAMCYKRTGKIELAKDDFNCIIKKHENADAQRFAEQALAAL